MSHSKPATKGEKTRRVVALSSYSDGKPCAPGGDSGWFARNVLARKKPTALFKFAERTRGHVVLRAALEVTPLEEIALFEVEHDSATLVRAPLDAALRVVVARAATGPLERSFITSATGNDDDESCFIMPLLNNSCEDGAHVLFLLAGFALPAARWTRGEQRRPATDGELVCIVDRGTTTLRGALTESVRMLLFDVVVDLSVRVRHGRFCHHCLAPHALRRCARCRWAHYCGAECQRADWPDHKSLCAETVRQA